MALVKCPECGNMVSDKASSCPHCGCPLGTAAKRDVMIKFPVFPGQVFRTKCFVYENGKEIASCNQGQTVTVPCDHTMHVTIKMQQFTGTLEQTINPGEKYVVDYKSGLLMPKLFITKVDVIM